MINIERQVVYNPKLFGALVIEDEKVHETKLKNWHSYRSNPISEQLHMMIVGNLMLYYEEDDFKFIKIYILINMFLAFLLNRKISKNDILSKLHSDTNHSRSWLKSPINLYIFILNKLEHQLLIH